MLQWTQHRYLFEALLLEKATVPRSIFAVTTKELTGPLNTERYMATQLEKVLPFTGIVGNAVELVEERCVPSREGANDRWDWIRIDDIPNQPWQVEQLRTVYGNEIQGVLYPIRENDILLAILGPTILNAKFVLAPRPGRQTVASPEFLVLRCRPGWQPEAVLWILRMKLYRDIM